MTDSTQTGAGSPTDGVIELLIDPRASRFTVQAFAGGMLSVLGHSPTFVAGDYQGEIHCNPETGAETSFKLTVKAASLRLMDDLGGNDRKSIEETMQDEVLESTKYPEIVYETPPSVSVAGGMLKVKDELKCSFDMVARP